MGRSVIKEAFLNVSIKDVIKRVSLNYTDIVSNNNKVYNLEIIETNDNKFYIYTNYGRVGNSLVKEYRECSSKFDAENQAFKIVNSKIKKGYVEVKLVQASIGSEIGKTKIETNSISTESLQSIGVSITDIKTESKLHIEVQSLISAWFGSTIKFIETNLDSKRCPLGQLSLEQIVKGKNILEEARKLIYNNKFAMSELDKLTSSYYSNIPHVLPHRINADILRFDTNDKIDKAYDTLDVFADAKSVQKVLHVNNNIDEQYNTLNADISFVDSKDPTWAWINNMLQGSRAHNHSSLGNLKIHKIFRVNRHSENDMFIKNAEKISKVCGKQIIPNMLEKYVPIRPDVDKKYIELYKESNILPLWHGTRKNNLIGITKNGILIRPSGVPHAGSLLGDAIYLAGHSSKSINYCDCKGACWSGGGSNNTGYLLLIDACLGNQLITTNHKFYTKSEIAKQKKHSVWAKVGPGGSLINDEFTIYNPTGPDQQHAIRYVIEFETNAK